MVTDYHYINITALYLGFITGLTSNLLIKICSGSLDIPVPLIYTHSAACALVWIVLYNA